MTGKCPASPALWAGSFIFNPLSLLDAHATQLLKAVGPVKLLQGSTPITGKSGSISDKRFPIDQDLPLCVDNGFG